MAWREIGPGNTADASLFKYHPITYPIRPVFPTYQVVTDALKNVLSPINDALDPLRQLQRAAQAKYLKDQLAGRGLPAGFIYVNGKPVRDPSYKPPDPNQVNADALRHGYAPDGHTPAAIGFNQNTGRFDFGEKPIDSEKAKEALPPLRTHDLQLQIPMSNKMAPQVVPNPPIDQGSAPSVPATNDVITDPNDPRLPINQKTNTASDEQISNTPVGINPPEYYVAPDIMTGDEYT